MKDIQNIAATKIIDLPNGRAISLTRDAGHIPDGTQKDGSPRLLSYASGSPILHGPHGSVLCGPIDYHGIKAFASVIASGTSDRASTEPGTAMRLATALLAIMSTLEFADASDLIMPAAAEESV